MEIFTYDFSKLSKSLDVPLLGSVSGYESLDNAKAAGADITDADIKCFAEIWQDKRKANIFWWLSICN